MPLRSETTFISGSRPGDPAVSFSLRDRQILELLCRRRSTKQIAADLHITASTVQKQIARVLRKLGRVIKPGNPRPTDRQDLIVWAMQHPEAVHTGLVLHPDFHPDGCACGIEYCVSMRRMDWQSPAA